MIRHWPVESASLNQHDAGFLQQFEKELLVIGNRVKRWIEPWKHVQGSGRLDASDTGDGGDQLVRQVTLPAQAAPFSHQIIDALVATQRGLNGPLSRHVGTEPHVREHVKPLDVIDCRFLVARNNHPTGPVAAGTVTLGQ